MPEDAKEILLKFRDRNVGGNTTIAVIATDAVLTKAGAKRLAISAHFASLRQAACAGRIVATDSKIEPTASIVILHIYRLLFRG